MNEDQYRSRKLKRLIKLEEKLSKSHPRIKNKLRKEITRTSSEIASRFLEVMGPQNDIVKDLIDFSQTDTTKGYVMTESIDELKQQLADLTAKIEKLESE